MDLVGIEVEGLLLKVQLLLFPIPVAGSNGSPDPISGEPEFWGLLWPSMGRGSHASVYYWVHPYCYEDNMDKSRKMQTAIFSECFCIVCVLAVALF